MRFSWPKTTLMRVADSLQQLVVIASALYIDQKKADDRIEKNANEDRKLMIELFSATKSMMNDFRAHVEQCRKWQFDVEKSLNALYVDDDDKQPN